MVINIIIIITSLERGLKAYSILLTMSIKYFLQICHVINSYCDDHVTPPLR